MKKRANSSERKTDRVPRPHDSPTNTKAIIVIGDWVIDYYWFLARHQSDTSSFTGYDHYKIASNPGDAIADICGAGYTTKIVYERKSRIENNFHIYAYGFWHEDDTPKIIDLLQSSVGPEGSRHFANAMFGGNFELRVKPDDISVQTLSKEADTLATQRCYQYKRGHLEQLCRIDWDRNNHSKLVGHAIGTIKNSSIDRDVVGIIVHDLGKGAISGILVEELINTFSNAMWYVRSKNGTQEWIKMLHENNKLVLNVAGPETTSIEGSWNKWILYGKPTLDGINYLNNMPGQITVAISKTHEVIIKSSITGACIAGQSGALQPLLTQLGWSSYFFSAFAFQLLCDDNNLPDDNDKVQAQIQALLASADKEPRIVEPRPRTVPDFETAYAVASNWDNTHKEWTASQHGVGIIDGLSKPRLELWRASSVLPGYIACVEEKRALIKRIGQALVEFIRGGYAAAPLNILLTADPGAGKTSLIKAFADAMKFSVISSNITQMLHRDELLHLYDELAARQANENMPIMVFVDEINATLEADHVFSAFLAPLEESAYLRQGRKVSLRPCVWVFVGTPSKDGRTTEYLSSDKYSDFRSRMTIVERMDYSHLKSIYGAKGLKQLDRECRLEQVYLGMKLLRDRHPDLSFVERQVIDSFHGISPASNPARLIRRQAASVRNVKDGTIRRENCRQWGEEYEWTNNEDLVEIV